jgi:hypothetical protein
MKRGICNFIPTISLLSRRPVWGVGTRSPVAADSAPARTSPSTPNRDAGWHISRLACRVAVPTCGTFGTDLMTRATRHEPNLRNVTGSQSVAPRVNDSTTAWEVTHGS